MRTSLGVQVIGFSCGPLLLFGGLALLGGCGDDDDAPAKDAGSDAGQGRRDAGVRDAGSSACTLTLSPGADDQTTLQGALIDVASFDTICLTKGRYMLEAQLSLDVDQVTLRGEAGTILDFSEQSSGANGLEITSDEVVIEDLRIENPKGDGVRATSVRDLIVRGVHVEWTAGPSPDNGGYGIYPVSSTGILIEDCFASGASDTGIYVGQSTQIIIRDNEVTQNVAGIEVENSTDAEVYNNHAHDNAAGILLFNLPGLPVKDGKRAHVHDNMIENNNHENFAELGNIVATVPSGTGMFILASDDNEVHGNVIRGNESGGISVISWYVTQRDSEGRMDSAYDFYPEGNYVHGNTFADNGGEPHGTAAAIAAIVGEDALPDMVWDGIVDWQKVVGETDSGEPLGFVPPEGLRNCFTDNGSGTFLMLDLEHEGASKSSDVAVYACTRPSLPPVEPPHITGTMSRPPEK
jgi:parallel beta-helix repeat protein